MNRSRWRKTLVALFLALFVLLLGLFNAGKPRILVLHSAAAGSSWSRGVNEGIDAVLAANRNPITVKHHYLGVEERRGEQGTGIAVNEAERTIALVRPDVLVAVDDRSNDLVARRHAGRDGIRVVFAAILMPPGRYGYDRAANVSGIVERLPLDAVRKAILATRENQPARIAVLAMDDFDGRAELAQVTAHEWAPNRLVATRASNSFADWQRFAAEMADTADVLLLLSYGGLARGAGDGGAVPRAEIVGWMEQNAKPLPIGLCVSHFEDGGGFSVTPSPADFGQMAMRMALDWIDSPAGCAPPAPARSLHFRIGLRESLLAARGVRMSPLYVETARLGNAYAP